MVSAERIMQFSDDSIPHEAPLVVAANRPPADWPSAGDVVFRDIQVGPQGSTLVGSVHS